MKDQQTRIAFLLLVVACILSTISIVGCMHQRAKQMAVKKDPAAEQKPATISECIVKEETVQFSAPVVTNEAYGDIESYADMAPSFYMVQQEKDPQLYKGDQYKGYDENVFVSTQHQAITTFSVDADGGSYSNTRRFLSEGEKPPKESIRIEEFINFFTYKYAEPENGENVSLHSEISECPWNRQNHLIRIGIKGRSIPNAKKIPSNFVFLIDVSGSMESRDRLTLLKDGFIKMTDGLGKNDKVAIVTYAGEAGVLLPSTSGNEKEKIKDAIRQLGSGGSTAGADGINTAYEIAKRNFIQGGNNRVILGTDGDFNVGISNTDELIQLIEQKRETGIFLTTLGVGRGNLNDHMMEQLANKGNGNYEYIDNTDQIKKIFIEEKSKFYTVAKDCKIQVQFNPDAVESYRLIGYENRSLNNKDFEDDTKDAGEIGASQTITAMYEVVLKDQQGDKPYANLDFRYKLPDASKSKLLHHTIKGRPLKIKIASDNQRFAASVVCFGLILKQSKYKGTADKKMVFDLAKNAIGYDPHGYRKEFIEMVIKTSL